jgi:catechol 2,3-dioxygenase-like lactoylglutathione lyase family enzyme
MAFPRNTSHGSQQMIDHVSLGVTDLERSRRFYDFTLRPLGLVRILDFEGRGFGLRCDGRAARGGVHDHRRAERGLPRSGYARLIPRLRPRVGNRAFHAAALRAGGRDDGSTGVRPVYHPDYYASFIRDATGTASRPCAMHPREPRDSVSRRHRAAHKEKNLASAHPRQ